MACQSTELVEERHSLEGSAWSESLSFVSSLEASCRTATADVEVIDQPSILSPRTPEKCEKRTPSAEDTTAACKQI